MDWVPIITDPKWNALGSYEHEICKLPRRSFSGHDFVVCNFPSLKSGSEDSIQFTLALLVIPIMEGMFCPVQ